MELSKIENLAFCGGGVKIIAEVGACEVLEQKGILKQLKRVGGTSAGAIISTLIALGYTVTEMKQMVYDLDFKKFEDGGIGEKLNVLRDYGINKGEYFLHFIQDKIVAKTGSKYTTFAGLYAKGFKDLNVFACNLNTGQLKCFSLHTTPNVAVCDAVRCSMSIPLFFEPHYLPNDETIYVDGGVAFNYPLKYFTAHNTIGVCFDSGEPTNNHLQKGQFNHYIKALISCLADSQAINLKEDEDALKRSIIIKTNESAINFDLSKEDKDRLYGAGLNAAVNFLG
jgi:NTE family protein